MRYRCGPRAPDSGFDAPDWSACRTPSPPPPKEAPRDRWPFKGWQRLAAHACDKRKYEMHLSDLTPACRALLLSQAGPFAARIFNVTPTRDDVTIPSALFRVLLLRRLRLSVPLAPCRCSCRGQLDQLGDHRSACATSGVLATRALPLDHAVARICPRGSPATSADLNVDVVADARRIEVVANGLPLCHDRVAP